MKTGQNVAIKKVFFSPKDAKSITVEVALLKAVQHANVVRLFASYLVQDQLWLVMELMDGGDLTGRIEAKAPFTEVPFSHLQPQIAFVARDIFKALAYCHSLNRMHRDIKSDNVLLTKKGEVKLADFGAAAELETSDQMRQTGSTHLTPRGRNALLDGTRDHQWRAL